MGLPILCLDFDGVLHSYSSGWQGSTVISDPVTPGFFEWADEAAKFFTLVVYSSRSKDRDAILAMQSWLMVQAARHYPSEEEAKALLSQIEFAHEKPPAFLTIDDRAVCFEGDWSALPPSTLRAFLPWNKKPPPKEPS